MSNKEKNFCEDCIHLDVCEWGVIGEDAFICFSFIGKNDIKRPQSEHKCKTCKYYHPYYEQFSNELRGDGYCVIARMTPEGLTTIYCNDEFSCSDYEVKKK